MSGNFHKFLMIFLALFVIGQPRLASADLIFEWPDGPLADPSRDASGSLLETIASTVKMLALREKSDKEAAKAALETARENSVTSTELFGKVVSIAAETSEKLRYEEMPSEKIEEYISVLNFFGLEPPVDELAVANIALDEAKNMASVLSERDLTYDEGDRNWVRALAIAINRIFFIGIATSDILREAP